jgi:hypothetical protein
MSRLLLIFNSHHIQCVDELIQRQENVNNLHHFNVFDVSHTVHSIDLSRFVVELTITSTLWI